MYPPWRAICMFRPSFSHIFEFQSFALTLLKTLIEAVDLLIYSFAGTISFSDFLQFDPDPGSCPDFTGDLGQSLMQPLYRRAKVVELLLCILATAFQEFFLR